MCRACVEELELRTLHVLGDDALRGGCAHPPRYREGVFSCSELVEFSLYYVGCCDERVAVELNALRVYALVVHKLYTGCYPGQEFSTANRSLFKMVTTAAPSHENSSSPSSYPVEHL